MRWNILLFICLILFIRTSSVSLWLPPSPAGKAKEWGVKPMLQVYTGAGKGKTTAAIGLLVRAVGAGMRVYMMQFM